MRFLQTTTTAFLYPYTPATDYSRTLCIVKTKGKFVTAATSTKEVFTAGAASGSYSAVAWTAN